jgi:hypothetical protein
MAMSRELSTGRKVLVVLIYAGVLFLAPALGIVALAAHIIGGSFLGILLMALPFSVPLLAAFGATLVPLACEFRRRSMVQRRTHTHRTSVPAQE